MNDVDGNLFWLNQKMDYEDEPTEEEQESSYNNAEYLAEAQYEDGDY